MVKRAVPLHALLKPGPLDALKEKEGQWPLFQGKLWHGTHKGHLQLCTIRKTQR